MVFRKRRMARSTGVTLEVAVLDYLSELATREERDRSYCINRIVREHAERHGFSLPPANEPAPEHRDSMVEEK